MTDAKTDYHESQVMDRIFENTAPDGANDGCYVALWSSSPANAPDNTNEISGDGYSPQQVTASDWTQVSASAPRQYENASEIDFGVLDSSSEVTVAGVVLYDGSDTGADNALWRADLDSSKTVSSGDEFKFNAGDLDVSED